MAEDAAQEYKLTLSELTSNNKTQINLLTILADDYRDYADAIVNTIEARLMTVTPQHKLLIMYVSDSILKNVRNTEDYKTLFAKKIVSMFSHVFQHGDEKIRSSLYKLRLTWCTEELGIFPASKLYQLDMKVNALDNAWPIANPQTGRALRNDPKVKVAAAPVPGGQKVFVNRKFIENQPNKPIPATAATTAVPQKVSRVVPPSAARTDPPVKSSTPPKHVQHQQQQRNTNDPLDKLLPSSAEAPTKGTMLPSKRKAGQMSTNVTPVQQTRMDDVKRKKSPVEVPRDQDFRQLQQPIQPPKPNIRPTSVAGTHAFATPPVVAKEPTVPQQPRMPPSLPPQPPMRNSLPPPVPAQPPMRNHMPPSIPSQPPMRNNLPPTGIPPQVSHSLPPPMPQGYAPSFSSAGSSVHSAPFNGPILPAVGMHPPLPVVPGGGLLPTPGKPIIAPPTHHQTVPVHPPAPAPVVQTVQPPAPTPKPVYKSEAVKLDVPQNNRIFVDQKAYEVIFIRDVAVIERTGLPHRIYFSGPPRNVIIDGVPHMMKFGESKTVEIEGKPHVIRFGAPSRELYMGDYPFKGQFGGPPIIATINGKRHEIRLTGSAPEVKIDPEPDYELNVSLKTYFKEKREGPTTPVLKQSTDDPFNLLKKLQKSGYLRPSMIPGLGDSANTNSKAVTNNRAPIVAPAPVHESPAADRIERRAAPPSLRNFNIRLLKVRYDSVIENLLRKRDDACKYCGLRMDGMPPGSEGWTNHMDWHVKRNLSKQESNQYQQWYPSQAVWLTAKAMEQTTSKDEEEEQKPKVNSGVAAEGQEECVICHERFKEYYDEDEEIWKAKDTVIVNDKVVHVSCAADVSQSESYVNSSVNIKKEENTFDYDEPVDVKPSIAEILAMTSSGAASTANSSSYSSSQIETKPLLNTLIGQ